MFKASFSKGLLARVMVQPLQRQMRGMTLGTRTAVIDAGGRVMLVRHSYAAGWSLPGGGVERGETIFASAIREVREEAGIVAGETPELRGFCLNDAQFPGDHVAIFVLRRFERGAWQPSLEISAAEFFDVSALPPEATPGTRRRLDEISRGVPAAQVW
jgi:8-oxo-dGTP pyrophosphatase MutT (NUDIX family)